MPRRREGESWAFANKTTESLTWDECYAVRASDWLFAGETPSAPRAAPESHSDHPKDKDPCRVLVKSSATSWSPPRERQRARSIGASRWRSQRHAAPRARGHHKFQPKFSGKCCQRSDRKIRYEYRPRIYRLRETSWQHLPVGIQPTKWYQVVGSMQCHHCKSLGRHQMTSWMCHHCKVPLCLMPHRNCYSQWHGERF